MKKEISTRQLFKIAFIVQILNGVVSWLLGSIHQDVCPRSFFPPILSFLIAMTSAIIALVAIFYSRNKPFAIAIFFVWLLILILSESLFALLAYGGLNWCNWTF